jgi:transposase
MWTETTREQYLHEGLRYASDMTDAEWAMVEPFMPAVKRLGRPGCSPAEPASASPVSDIVAQSRSGEAIKCAARLHCKDTARPLAHVLL